MGVLQVSRRRRIPPPLAGEKGVTFNTTGGIEINTLSEDVELQLSQVAIARRCFEEMNSDPHFRYLVTGSYEPLVQNSAETIDSVLGHQTPIPVHEITPLS